jgi:hypothetical protein
MLAFTLAKAHGALGRQPGENLVFHQAVSLAKNIRFLFLTESDHRQTVRFRDDFFPQPDNWASSPVPGKPLSLASTET